MEGIDHPEDLIIAQGSKGADRVIQELSKLESDPSTISIKWDGLPALVWGRDKDGEFQLVDKHQFEKISKGKAEFSTIRAYDEARGANRSSLWTKEDILRPALEAATPQVRDQYWFGDFMYAGTPPVKNGRFVFKPNTVEYRVSEQGQLGEKIAASSAGMAVHTFIPGLGSDDQPLVGLKGLDDGAGVVFFLGEIKDKPTVKVDNTILARAQAVVNEHRTAVDKFIADLTEMKGKSVITSMSPFITRMLEEDDISGNIVPRFLEFLPERLTPAAAEKMLGKNKDGWLYQADGGGPGLLGIWSMWAAVTELKISVKQLLDTQMGGSEVQALTDGVDAHEGYVFGAGKDKLKLVDRLGFTKANFARYRVPDEEKTAKAKMPMAAFCFGRMNPPTLGHGLVMEKTIAEGGKDSYIFLSNSQGKDDPLDPATKAAFIKKMYPKFAGHIVDDYVQGPIYAANWLYDRGFRNITFVGGSDRLGKAPGSIEKLLNGWNSGPVRTTDAARGDTGREYVNLRFVSSGDRDPDAAGVAGYSGSKARQAALQGDEMKFWEFTGTKPDLKVGAVNLYQATRAGLGVKDEPTQEDMWSQLDEGVSIDGSVKSIVATGDSIAKVYGDLKTMAEKWVYNNGQLKGFHRNAAGVGKRWYDTFYWGKMENDLRTLLEKNPKGAAKLQDFFNIERDDRGHVSFTTISKSLPEVLYQVGERMDSRDLKRFARNWFDRQNDYEDFLSTVEKRINDEEEDDVPATASAPRDNVVGRQNAAAEDIVNQILRSIDKKAAGEIRNIIAREPNKLQALQKELAKRNIKVGESIRRMESQGVSEGSYTTKQQILTRIRQIMHDRKLSGTESNAGELLRLKQQLKDLRSQQGVAEADDVDASLQDYSDSTKANIKKNDEALAKLKTKLDLVPFFTNPKTKTPVYVYDNSDRYTVVVNYGGMNLPFYYSTGRGGKANVPADHWYPFFGVGTGSGGWINKGSSAQINDYYGSSILKSISKTLDNTFTPVRDPKNVWGWGMNRGLEDEFKKVVNRSFPETQEEGTFSQDGFARNANPYLKKLGGLQFKSDDSAASDSKTDVTKPTTTPTQSAGNNITGAITLKHNGKEITTLNISALIGRHVVKNLGDDSKFWDSEQFNLQKDKDGTWMLITNPNAPNKTIVNGQAVTSPVKLKQNMVISVGNPIKKIEKLPITVTGKGVAEEEGDLDEDWRKKLAAAGMAGMMAVGGAAGAADRMPEPVKDPIIATLVIDGEARELDLTPLGFKDVKAAESYIKKFMKDRGIMDWQAKIERSQPGTGRYERVRITGAGGLESTEYDNDQTLDEMFDMFGPVSSLEMAVNLLTALSIPMAVMGPVVFNRIKNKIQKMHSRRIIDLLSQKQIKVDKVTKRMLERSLDDLQQALDRDDGEAAKRLALEIRQIARDADDRPVANEDIRKVKGGYRLVSKKSGRNLGTYPTRAGAEKRERQVQFFKHRG